MNLFALLLSAFYFVNVSQCSTPITVIDPPPTPTCDRTNEVYSDNISPCGNTCKNYGQRCTIVNKKAITGCDCIKGYARLGENGKCVKIDSPKCVQRYLLSKGSTNATLGQFPYQVEITAWHKKAMLCGGSIISQNFVLTAAHCTHDSKHAYLEQSGLGILAGSIVQGKGVYIVSKSYTNPADYKPGVFDHDICVINLRTPLAFSNTVKAINLPDAKFVLDYGSPITISGWGLTSSGKTSSTLQYVVSTSISLAVCETWFPSVKDMENRVICANYGGSGPWTGDTGGVMVKGGVIVGLPSYGALVYKSGVQPGPSVFTNVAFYRDWIKHLTKV